MEARSWGFPALLVLLCVTTAAGARSVPGYFENLSPSTYLPGQHVVLTVANPPDPVARIYALPLERAERTYRSVQWDPAAVEGLAPLASGRFRPQGDGHTQTLDVGPLAAGYYAVAIGDGKNRQQFGFCVSSFGLMSAGVGGETVLWAIDLRTYNTERQPITMSAGASDGGPRRTLRVGADAVALDTTEGRNGDQIAVATLPDGSVQIAGEYGYLGNLREGMFVSTDRPIYRPGQVVNIRAIVRNGGVGTYTIPRGTVHVRITPAGARRVLSDRTLSVSRFGTVSWAVRLPQNAATGPYQISLDDQHYAGHFDVEAYKKPEFTLQLTTKRAWTIAGEPTTVHVAARYLFGRAAAGLRLHYAVNAPGWYRPTRTMPLPLRSYWDIPPERSSDVADGDETTDSAGQVDLKFTAPAADREKLIAIRVDGLDASGQTVSTQLSLIDHAASFVVEAQPASWFVSVGRSSTIDIRTRNDDGTVRPKQTLTLTTRRLQWNDGRRRYDELGRASQTVVTAADGTAAVPWVPAEAGSYEFVVQGTDERARVTSGSVYAVASTAESAGSGVLPDRRIHIIPEKRTVAPGERARLLVVAPVADR
ncbi:MAG TPA: MG2 domain-containing protein, partial [Candidatus Tumulicola sp.]|nr:MG2 domain-containing protein [Candidatus Tumulicola sp.]